MITLAAHLLALAIGYRLARLNLFRPELLPWPHYTPRTEKDEAQ